MGIHSEIDQLRVFCRVVRLGSFTKAAEELYLTQPAVSAQVAKLERRLKIKLVDRLGRRVYPTEAGKLLYSYAEQVDRLCDLLAEAEQAVTGMEGELSGKITIGASTTIAIYVLPSLLRQFKRMHPKVEIALAVNPSRYLIEGIPDNRYDFCLLEGPASVPGVDFEHFMYDELCLVIACDHPWVERAAEGVSIHELVHQTFISHSQGSGVQTAIQREFDRHGVQVVPSMVIDNIEVVKKVVEAGLGVSILSRLIISGEVERGTLVVVPVRDAVFRREFRIATRRGRHLPRSVCAFISFLKEQVSSQNVPGALRAAELLLPQK